MMKKLDSIIKMTISVIIILLVVDFAMAREFVGAVESVGEDIREVLMVVGALALMIAGGAFYLSRQMGMERLSAAIIGTVIFASSSTLFSLIYRSFN